MFAYLEGVPVVFDLKAVSKFTTSKLHHIEEFLIYSRSPIILYLVNLLT